MTGTAFTVNRGLAVLFAGLALAVPLLLARLFAGHRPPAGASPAERRRRGLGALTVGTDGRVSTSKVQAVLWTLAVFFAIAYLLVWGRSIHCSGPSVGAVGACADAAAARSAFDAFVNRGLQAEYFVLLGLPIGVAVAAKAITQSQVDDGLVKPSIGEEDAGGGLRQSVREIVTNDAGEIDLLDAQYFAFNLLALAFFFVQFLTQPAHGLPDLPPTLVALTGVSAAGYTTKKSLSGTNAPRLSAREATPTSVTAEHEVPAAREGT